MPGCQLQAHESVAHSLRLAVAADSRGRCGLPLISRVWNKLSQTPAQPTTCGILLIANMRMSLDLERALTFALRCDARRCVEKKGAATGAAGGSVGRADSSQRPGSRVFSLGDLILSKIGKSLSAGFSANLQVQPSRVTTTEVTRESGGIPDGAELPRSRSLWRIFDMPPYGSACVRSPLADLR